MNGQFRPSHTRIWAQGALERLVARVRPHVHIQIPLGNKHARTQRAGKWLLASVITHVLVQ